MTLNVAIIGSGLQCKRRAPVVLQDPRTHLVCIAGNNLEQTQKVANEFDCQAVSVEEALTNSDVDIVIMCTPPHVHKEHTIKALEQGKHVLCEKPLAKTLEEGNDMVAVANKANKILKCGFNHRYHPAIMEAKKMANEGKLGNLIFARCAYGICGRPDYEEEWRADPKQAAGGQFIEQGVHAIDLFRWFFGDITQAKGMMSNHVFKKMPMEDDGMALFRFASGATAQLHTSICQWKNLFRLEIFGDKGYAIIEGLGGSYGNETLTTGKNDPVAPFQDTITHFRGGDKSWLHEWNDFIDAIQNNKLPMATGEDGVEAMKAAHMAYDQ